MPAFTNTALKQTVQQASRGGNRALEAVLSSLVAPTLGTVAAAGSTASDATTLAYQHNVVTGADGAKGVALPEANSLSSITIVNDSNTYAIKVYPISGGNDAVNELAEDDPFIVGPEAEVTFRSTSSTQWYAPKGTGRVHAAAEFEIFDDFLDASLDTTNNWVIFLGSDGDATGAVTVTAPEGKVNMGSGGAGITNDGSVMSLILLAKGSLVSLGTTVFETRVSFDQILGTSWCFGLSDKLAEATERNMYKVNSGTVSDGGLTLTNAICWCFDTDATAGTKWQFCHENAGTIGNSGSEDASGNGPTADTYDTLRIEVDASGDARFYLNGVLEKSEQTAVATTALLIPFIGGNSADDADIATDTSIDYIKFSGHRPSSNA